MVRQLVAAVYANVLVDLCQEFLSLLLVCDHEVPPLYDLRYHAHSFPTLFLRLRQLFILLRDNHRLLHIFDDMCSTSSSSLLVVIMMIRPVYV